jgi:hypothetical protein
MVFILFYLVVIISGIISLVYYYKLYSFVGTVSSEYAKEVRGLFAYPLILFLSWAPALFDLFYTSVLGQSSFSVRMVHVIASHLQGFMNALTYGILERVKIFIKPKGEAKPRAETELGDVSFDSSRNDSAVGMKKALNDYDV